MKMDPENIPLIDKITFAVGDFSMIVCRGTGYCVISLQKNSHHSLM